ncbi:MAG: ATP-dependent DNA helicase RecG [Bacillota bacterium]|nr:ATP-dependent DNA helicase RecG [Bacillota bacterium]
MKNILNQKISIINGIGPKYEEYLNNIGIKTIRDLFYYTPYDYEDRRYPALLSQVKINSKNLIKIKITKEPKLIRTRRSLTIIMTEGRDESGRIDIKWFNQNFIKSKINNNTTYYLYGIIKRDKGKLSITNPEFSIKLGDKLGVIYPKYSLTKGLTNNFIKKIVKKIFHDYCSELEDLIPVETLNEYDLISRKEAIKNIHYPDDFGKLKESIRYVEIEKLILMQIAFQKRKDIIKSSKSKIIYLKKDIKKVIERLPFELTKYQKKVFKEITEDMNKGTSMNRLLQGDVGSGKTIIAFLTLINVSYQGYQGALMVPTEVLAKQHFNKFQKMFGYLGIKIEVLYSSLKNKKKKEILTKIKAGEISIVIGTHSLIQKEISFKKLAYIITDEQHRFGVEQRANLLSKGEHPHNLVMSATPIPRTLAMIIYNDLDISTIDKNPPGRKKVKTYIINSSNKGKLYKFLKTKIGLGEQAYIVSPIIEESEKLENINSAEKIFKNFLKGNFKKEDVCLLHGKMKTEESEKIIGLFTEGKCKILISTTVIEVGVDIQNATIMIIINAERFGLAQLHQLRGRVGRGEKQSYCFLVSDSDTEKSIKRLNILERTNNGFEISKEDLKLRGPGEFLGTKQSGIPEEFLNFDMKNINISKEIKDIIVKKFNDNDKKYDKILNEAVDVYKDRIKLN